MAISYLWCEKIGRHAMLLTEISLSSMHGNKLYYHRFVYIYYFPTDGLNKLLLHCFVCLCTVRVFFLRYDVISYEFSLCEKLDMWWESV